MNKGASFIGIFLGLAVGTAMAGDWKTDVVTNPVNDAKIKIVTTESTNSLELSFPYNAAQHGVLGIRSGDKNHNDVFIALRRGLFNCPISCTVYVRADGEKAKKFSASTPDDFSQQGMLFINDKHELMKMIGSAKTLRIVFDVYSDGQQYLDFNVTGYPSK